MAFPTSIDPETPQGTDQRSSIDNEIRDLKQFIADVFGLPTGTTNITAAAFSITAAGAVKRPNTKKDFPLTMVRVSAAGSSPSMELKGEYLPVLAYDDTITEMIWLTTRVPEEYDPAKAISIHFDYAPASSGSGNFRVGRDYRIVGEGERVDTEGNAGVNANTTLAKTSGANVMAEYTGTDLDIPAADIAAVGETMEILFWRAGANVNDTASGDLYIWNLRRIY